MLKVVMIQVQQELDLVSLGIQTQHFIQTIRGITINFTDNNILCVNMESCDASNSIYVKSIDFCFWPGPLLHDHDNCQTFCWSGWTYYLDMYEEDDCRYQLASGPAYAENMGPTSYTVYPWRMSQFRNYSVYDGWDNDKTNITNAGEL